MQKGSMGYKNLHGNKRERALRIYYFLNVSYQENIEKLYFSTELRRNLHGPFSRAYKLP